MSSSTPTSASADNVIATPGPETAPASDEISATATATATATADGTESAAAKPPRRLFSRRAFLYGGTAALAGAASFFPVLGEAHRLEVTHTPLRLTRVPLARPIRVLHMSDFHASEHVPMSLIRRAVALGIAEKPDIILLTGDYITYKFTDWDDYSDALAPLARCAPTYAVKGNHDGGRYTVPPLAPEAVQREGEETSMIHLFLAKAGVQLLSNEARSVRIHGQDVNVVGIGDYWSHKSRPRDAFARVTREELAQRPTLVMAHNPDTKEVCKPWPWDLMLCGHTHGGQILLPYLPPLRLPVRDKRYYRGLMAYDNRHLYITRGVGSLWGIRMNCRPEVSIIDLA
ncbi:MAG: phosphodiesterase YaeI [Candidatus Methylacidiphilales bacterium]|nr:phosphodiesterase YaeI [Candidatus Methylacidiphilales bacterium]